METDREYRVGVCSMSAEQEPMSTCAKRISEFLASCNESDGHSVITHIPVGDATMVVVECLDGKMRPAIEDPS